MKTTTKTVSFDLAKVLLTEDQLSDLISTAMADTCGFEWWKEGDPSDYDKAEEELAKELGVESDDLYFEQIWARMLFNGGSLLLLESESDWHWKGFDEGTILWNWQIKSSGTEPEGGTWHEITLEKICKGLALYMTDKKISSVDKIIEDGDFWDADAVFQYAAYGEVIFG